MITEIIRIILYVPLGCQGKNAVFTRKIGLLSKFLPKTDIEQVLIRDFSLFSDPVVLSISYILRFSGNNGDREKRAIGFLSFSMAPLISRIREDKSTFRSM